MLSGGGYLNTRVSVIALDLQLAPDLEILKKCYGVNLDVIKPFSVSRKDFENNFQKMKKSVFRFYTLCIVIFTSLGVFGAFFYKAEPLLSAFLLFMSVYMNLHSVFYLSVRLRAIGSASFVAQKHNLI